MASQDDFQRTVDRLLVHMRDGEGKAQAVAAVTIALMLQSPQSQQFAAAADLGKVAAHLAALLDSPEAAVQRNATAALSACLECNNAAVQAAIECQVAERAVSVLQSLASIDSGSGGGTPVDAGLQLNLLVLLGTLCEVAEATAQLVVEAGGLQQLLGSADPAAAEQLQVAAVDGMCKLAASSEAAKDAAAAAGAVPRLAALLGSNSGAEVRVRALLCLGMLVDNHPARQVELAQAPGAMGALLCMMRQLDDGDCQQIAVGLFKELAANADAKEAITAALKEQQAADGAAKFV